MSGNVNREVCSRACERHNVIFNQSRTRESSGTQWGPWFPVECPQCVEETAQRVEREERIRKFNEEELPTIKAEILAESERSLEQSKGMEEVISARADELEAEWLAAAWASNRKAFLARAKSEILATLDDAGIKQRRAESLERQAAEESAAAEALQQTLDKKREDQLTESLRGFATLA